MPIITECIDYECKGLLNDKWLHKPENIAKKFNISIEKLELIEKENKNGKLSTFLRIPILIVMKSTPTAERLFTFRCDECGKEITTTIGSFLQKYGNTPREIPKSLNDEIFCKNCKTLKTILERYGVENPAQSSEIREKAKQTSLKRYGYEFASQSPIIQEKTKQTNLERYGVEFVSQNPEIYAKVKKTNLKRYGVEYTSQVPEIREKMENTMFEKYGVNYPTQSPVLREKMKQTLFKNYGVTCTFDSVEIQKRILETKFDNNSAPTSINQNHIFNLLLNNNETVVLNYPYKKFLLDVALIDSHIDLEYDGKGHDLCVRLGGLTRKEFKQKEIKRGIIIRNSGWKELRIISKRDKLPDDNTLLNMIYLAKEYLLNTNHTWINIDLDNKCFIFTKDRITVSFDSLKTIL